MIAYADADGIIRPMVTEQYLRSMLEVANARFVGNSQRKERFREALLHHTTGCTTAPDWEPTEVRNARKRAEGLRRKEEMQQQKATAETNAVADILAPTDDEALFPPNHT